ncbi:transcriptional regulator, GntR family [Corynebacterium mycetoides]|uniref:Transcriptional regulator, GntR family n=1 Tax=Corynebacterium mycetoides TaxID=38302 RepID=A0A1G9MCB0_9CORY|nr:PLP-dependent aminotransferase family protein [Corynebacterium mycetoides]SDL71631.1 transcriptional regulator, GntR family [Corynebacterium mycetoides]
MFAVDRSLPTSLPAQIVSGMRGLVAAGELTGGDRVPSTRELARQLGVSRGSVVTAYDQLLSEGVLLSAQGAPTVVHPDLPRVSPPPPPVAAAPHPAAHRALSLRPSSGHPGTIPPAAWRSAWREAAAMPAQPADKSGQAALRRAIAGHLRLARGLAVSADNVLVTGGSREGLLLILMSLGRDLRIGVEDPGHPGLRSVIPLAGHTPVTCETDELGIDVASLPGDLDAVLVTPSHLYPLGASMPASRRLALLEWAATNGVTVIEDDFNSELRHRVSPLPTLGMLASEASVITLGTFSTLLSTQLNAGYVVADAVIAQALRATRQTLGMPVSPVTQHAIAHLLEGGFVRRNTRVVHKKLTDRMDRLRDAVVPALEASGALITLGQDCLGADIVAAFPTSDAQEQFVGLLARREIEVGRAGPDLLLSFGHLSDDDFGRAVRILTGLTPTRPR